MHRTAAATATAAAQVVDEPATAATATAAAQVVYEPAAAVGGTPATGLVTGGGEAGAQTLFPHLVRGAWLITPREDIGPAAATAATAATAGRGRRPCCCYCCFCQGAPWGRL